MSTKGKLGKQEGIFRFYNEKSILLVKKLIRCEIPPKTERKLGYRPGEKKKANVY